MCFIGCMVLALLFYTTPFPTWCTATPLHKALAVSTKDCRVSWSTKAAVRMTAPKIE